MLSLDDVQVARDRIAETTDAAGVLTYRLHDGRRRGGTGPRNAGPDHADGLLAALREHGHPVDVPI